VSVLLVQTILDPPLKLDFLFAHFNSTTQMLFHLLDVLAHDFIVEAEDETTVQGHYEYNRPDADSDGEFEEDARPRAPRRETRREFTIELFGVTAEGKPVHTKVSGFQPYFYLELPVTVSAESIGADLCRRLERFVPNVRKFMTFEKVKRSLLFGYTANRQFPMVKISVPSLDLFRKLKDIVLTKKLQPTYKPLGCTKPLEVYEANLDPMLRFFHMQKLEPCGWVEADCEFEEGEAGRLQGECHWTDVTAPKKKPATSGSALIASWDIECYSPDGDFPVPEKRQYPIIQIGVVLVRPGGTPDRHCFVLDTCSPVQGVTIHVAKTEKDLLLDWAAHMCQWDPDVLIGYNIFGFDERYVWKRAELLGIEASAGFQGFSRFEGQEVKLQEKMLSSSALGDNKLYILTTPGRLQIDLYHYIKRQEALPSYKLDDVTSHYMSGKLKGLYQTEGLVHLKTTVTKDVRIGRSIKILDETGEPVAEKCVVVSAAGGEIVVRTDEPLDDTDLALAKKWAIVKDDVPPAEIFRLHREGGADGRATVADYCVQDCNLVLELFNKLDVFNNAMSMANVCSVPVNYIFTRGQGIKIESLIFRECALRGQVVKVLEAPANNAFNKKVDDTADEEEPEEESYEGAIVFPPKPDFYFDSPVGVCDFASLYPSSIISENISYDTLVWVRDVKPDGSWVYSYGGEPAVVEPGVQFTDIEFDILRPDPNDTRKHPEKIKDGLRICRYAQLGNTKGTLPAILQMLLASRKAKRKQAEKETDPFVKALLDAEQLAYKLTANSLYGQLGSPTFKIRLQALAASTTAYGRKQITFAKEAISEFYGIGAQRHDCCAELVYGDTDSLFVNFNPRGADGNRLEGREAVKRTIELTEECGKFITAGLKAPHDFEYDKTFWPFIIFSKKRYVGNKYEESADEFKQNYMGIVLKRRDNAPIVKTIYGGAINILLNQRNVAAAAEFVRQKCAELVSGKVSLGQLTITKSLRANYANPTRIAHKVLADRIAERDPGNAPASGDRIPYVYITKPDAILQGDRIEMPSYVREHGLRPDIPFYIEHQLSSPLAQLFSLRVEEVPGFPGKPSGWSPDADRRAAEREKMAMQLLFQESLRLFEAPARRAAIERMGFTVLEKESAGSAAGVASAGGAGRVVSVEPVPQKKQVVLSSYWAGRIEEAVFKKSKKEQAKNGTKPK